MVIFRNGIIAALVISAGVFAFIYFIQSDEARIKKQFKTFAVLASKVPDESEFKSALNARRMGDMFSETCLVEIPYHNISRTYAREKIPANIMGARSPYSEISLAFHDLEIRFPEEKRARTTFTAYVEARLVSGESVREAHEIACWLEKIEKDWFVNKLEVVTVLER